MTSKSKPTHKYIKKFEKQRAKYRQQSRGAAGPCVSLVTGEVRDPNPRYRSKPIMISCYQVYLESKIWREVRDRYLASDQKQTCFVCDQPWQAGFQFHHLTYERIGCELLSDITPICEKHHKLVHQLHKRFPYMSIRDVSNAARIQHIKETRSILP